MHIEKRREVAFLGYFSLLLLLVITSMRININIINMVYFVVVLCCFFKFILIVNNEEK